MAYDLPENPAGQSHARWSKPAEEVVFAELLEKRFCLRHCLLEKAKKHSGLENVSNLSDPTKEEENMRSNYMKQKLGCVVLILTLISINSYAGTGPTNLGSIVIGMSKAQYVSVIGINPVDCNAFKDWGGKSKRSEMKYLNPESKTLCWGFEFTKSGSIENIQVGEISYDVIEANYESSKYIQNIGHSSRRI